MGVHHIQLHTCDHCGMAARDGEAPPLACGFPPVSVGSGWVKAAAERGGWRGGVVFLAWDLCEECRRTMTVEEFLTWARSQPVKITEHG